MDIIPFLLRFLAILITLPHDLIFKNDHHYSE